MLQAGFVGLPNVGKTTLFNAVTAQSSALIANYAFSTSKPNVGVVAVADLATIERRRERVQKTAKSGDKTARAELEVVDKLQPALEEFQPARSVSLNDEELAIARNYFLLTMKPTIYAANVNEATLNSPH